MIAKTVEIRDRATFIPALAVKLEPGCEADRYLLGRAGYSDEQAGHIVFLVRINGDEYYGDGGRTIPRAHEWLTRHFDEIRSGAVVDVEFILGESTKEKLSEAVS